jgi:ABC-type lipoprotein export system ATPase subunit
MTDLLVRARAVTKSYPTGDTLASAVRGASFDIPAGARIALVGPSGSGKSTLVHLIAGLDRPTAGELCWPALRPAGAPAPGSIGVAFQAPSLLPELTVGENVALPLLLAGSAQREAQDAAAEMLRRFALGQVADRLPEEISAGQAQRAALARALLRRPRLVLADEPTGQQDRATALATVTALLDWADQTAAALLLTTHDATVAGWLADRWLLVNHQLYPGEAPRSP